MPGFRGRGVLARILYSLPENTDGRRQVGAGPTRPGPHRLADPSPGTRPELQTGYTEDHQTLPNSAGTRWRCQTLRVM